MLNFLVVSSHYLSACSLSWVGLRDDDALWRSSDTWNWGKNNKEEGKIVLNKALFIFWEKKEKNENIKLETENNSILLGKVWNFIYF